MKWNKEVEMSKIKDVKKHPQCKYSEVRCPNREDVNGSCLLKNPFDCQLFEPNIADISYFLGLQDGKTASILSNKKTCQGCPDRYEDCMTKAECQARVERILDLMNRRDSGGVEPEWALSNKDYQSLRRG